MYRDLYSAPIVVFCVNLLLGISLFESNPDHHLPDMSAEDQWKRIQELMEERDRAARDLIASNARELRILCSMRDTIRACLANRSPRITPHETPNMEDLSSTD